MNIDDIFTALLAEALKIPGIEIIKLPWDRHKEVNIVDPVHCKCDAETDIAKVMDSAFVIGYFMHYDRDNIRRWYGYSNWMLLSEYATVVELQLKAQEGNHEHKHYKH